MKTLLIISGVLIAVTVMFISFSPRPSGSSDHALLTTASPAFKWTEVAPPGSGTHEYEWKAGTYPSALVPLVAFDGDLWMVGRKRSWSSRDGVKWIDHKKTDWGGRISTEYVFFHNRLWALGGMVYDSNTFLNEIWSSSDGKTWTKMVEHAAWSPRKGQAVVAFNNKLWLMGGAIHVDEDRTPDKFVNDVWSSADGIRWTKIGEAPWDPRDHPRVLVFRNALWMIGGQGHSDIWRTDDGSSWVKVKAESPWKDRYDYGAMSFNNLLWVYGGETALHDAYHDVWFSADGLHWQLQADDAGWSPRSGGSSAVFREKLWLYGGKHKGHKDSYSGDIWTMEPVNDQ